MNPISFMTMSTFTRRCLEAGCSARFGLQSKLDRHMKKHTKGYTCLESGCGVGFSTWLELVKHNSTAHSATHTCNVCHKAFSKAFQLARHQKVHEINEYRCDIGDCQRVYQTQSNLNAHIRANHMDVLQFSCDVAGCGARFMYKVRGITTPVAVC